MPSGTYFDGSVARPRPVAFEFTSADTLRVTGEDVTGEFPLAALRVSDRLGDVPRFLYLPDDAIIETPDNAAVDAALRERGRARAAGFIHFLESHRAIAAVGCVLLLLGFATIGYFGPPWLARVVAHRVPAELDRRLGEIALSGIRPYFAPSSLSRAERDRALEQLKRLRPGAAAEDLPDLHFYAMHGAPPNAFALPGDIIIVTDEIVRLPTRDDELAAVLAHELAHLEHRHGLQTVLQDSFALLVVTAVTGDLSTLTSFAAAIPFSILTKGHSRELEREADRSAIELLRTRGIEPENFTTLLVKLEAARSDLYPESANYLSTHPTSEEREALAGVLSEEKRAAVLAEGDTAPVVISQFQPHYPPSMRRRNLEGRVVVDFRVTASGEVEDASAISSTHQDFEGPAVLAVRQWRFQPARTRFRPTETRMQVPIVFTLRDPPAPHFSPRDR